ncbi:MAG: NTF2 fold immunity protein [Candidatus Acidiferrales bacterium]
MKPTLLTIILFVVLVIPSFAQHEQAKSFAPKEGFVPNAETAVKVAEAVLLPVYGEEQIISERPFKAALDGDVWTVTGTLHCAGKALTPTAWAAQRLCMSLKHQHKSYS